MVTMDNNDEISEFSDYMMDTFPNYHSDLLELDCYNAIIILDNHTIRLNRMICLERTQYSLMCIGELDYIHCQTASPFLNRYRTWLESLYGLYNRIFIRRHYNTFSLTVKNYNINVAGNAQTTPYFFRVVWCRENAFLDISELKDTNCPYDSGIEDDTDIILS